MITYRAGIDIGSTTVKLVLLNEDGRMIVGEYRRHCAHTQEALSALLREAREQVGSCALQAKITGSGAINLAKALGIPFIQEVVAVADAYDALTSKRSYKEAYSHERAIDMIKNGECGRFNPILIECLDDIRNEIKEDVLPENAKLNEDSVLRELK